MATKKMQIVQEDGTILYPQTSDASVVMKDGSTLDDWLSSGFAIGTYIEVPVILLSSRWTSTANGTYSYTASNILSSQYDNYDYELCSAISSYSDKGADIIKDYNRAFSVISSGVLKLQGGSLTIITMKIPSSTNFVSLPIWLRRVR